MREQITENLTQAIKAQDKRRMATLRLVSAAIKDRDVEARGNGKERVSDDELLEILAKMVKQRNESIKVYEEAGRLELAEQEREEKAIINEFLPQQMAEDEVSATCAKAIAELEAEGLRDMGKVMSHLKSTYPGQMDFGKASCVVKSLLL
ncbi:GatB/YqeY domain-containing protein [Cohaesibacter celericrescens]|uniref:Glutamyl-tRNA amidotransferase n=1 Tax=Cohaesibacter celericrescens TaxID=2067669 RepID=A0A2N5XX80_9HYPH|nr:GatB/YqeY domain-containing protein [Cohaesibacter celericrescens]PLW79110.1 glutamyl-tRNA amidotransferase [Cohaesibacter celericrescens]